MSDTDSFIDEVTEEVRRDQLYAYLRRYGWIAVLAILLIVGGAAWNEYRKSRAEAEAQVLGDAIVAALAANETGARAEALAGIAPTTPGNGAVLQMMRSATEAESGQTEAAVQGLNRIASDGNLPEIYRQIAAFKALLLQSDTLSADDRRLQFTALAVPGKPLRLLAEEQLALIDIAEGETDAALTRLQAILQDAESTRPLQERVAQLIVALGGTPQPVAQSQG